MEITAIGRFRETRQYTLLPSILAKEFGIPLAYYRLPYRNANVPPGVRESGSTEPCVSFKLASAVFDPLVSFVRCCCHILYLLDSVPIALGRAVGGG